MTAGQDRGKHERVDDQDVVEDLAPREDESAELKGGMSSENANLHDSGGGKKT